MNSIASQRIQALVEDQLRGDRGALGRQRAGGEFGGQIIGRREQADAAHRRLMIFCQAAVVVTMASQASGTSVTSA